MFSNIIRMILVDLNEEYSRCCVCGTKLRSYKHLDFLGCVCSKCYRMSKKKYCHLVDKMALKKSDLAMKEVKTIKERI